MNSTISVEYTQLRVNNSGDPDRKYYLSADIRLGGDETRVHSGSIQLLDGRTIGDFNERENSGFSLNINSGYQCDRAEVFAEVDSFIAAIKEEGGEG